MATTITPPVGVTLGLRAERAARITPVWVLRACVGVVDVSTIILAMIVAYALRRILPSEGQYGRSTHYLGLASLSLPLWVGLFTHYELYNVRHVRSRLDELQRVVHATGASVTATAVVGFMLQWYVARGWLLLTFVAGVLAVMTEREFVRAAFARSRRRGQFCRRVVIIGGNAEGVAIAETLAADRSLGYDVAGFVAADQDLDALLYGESPVIGRLDTAVAAVVASGVTAAVIATTAVDFETTNRLIRRLTDAGIDVELSSSLRDIAAERLTLHPLGCFSVMSVEPARRHGWRAAAKRSFDIVVSSAGLVVAAIPLIAVSIAVKLDSRGTLLFKQERVGRDGRRFRVFKFRTMVADAEARRGELLDLNEADGPLFKLRDDPRVTRVGRVLRKVSIDEIPQLWNVLRGEMSLVGPRPALPDEVKAWSPDLHGRLRVRPGITGMWQVSGRSDASFDEYARLDLYYVENWSLSADMAILAKTIPTVLLRRGAY